jgi:hypothetical protein
VRLGLDVLLFLASLLSLTLLMSAQSISAPDPASKPAPTYKFLSGTVVEVNADSLVVRRSPLGRSPKIRKFRLTPETRIEGNLKANARVTVGYTSSEDGHTAVRVIVRPAKKQISLRPLSIGRTLSSRAVSWPNPLSPPGGCAQSPANPRSPVS